MSARTDNYVVVPSDAMFWHGPTRTFSAEYSTVVGAVPALDRFAPPDALLVRSAATGKVVGFRLRRTDRDRDGDVSAWEYANDAFGMKLVFFND